MIKKKNLLNYCGLLGADDKSRGGKASGRTYGSFPTGNAGRLKE